MTEKEKLQKRLKEIKEKEWNDIIEKHYPEFKKLEGKCFKVRNSYSLPKSEDNYWWYYVKILKIKKDYLYEGYGNILSHYDGMFFQEDENGEIRIDFNYGNYVHSLEDENEISTEEFSKIWNNLLNKINNWK